MKLDKSPGSVLFSIIFSKPKPTTVYWFISICLSILILGWSVWMYKENISFKESLEVAFSNKYATQLKIENVELDLSLRKYIFPFSSDIVIGKWNLNGESGIIKLGLSKNQTQSVQIADSTKVYFKRMLKRSKSGNVTFADHVVQISIENISGVKSEPIDWPLHSEIRGVPSANPKPPRVNYRSGAIP